MTLFENQVLFAKDVALLIKYITDNDMVCVFGETFKTPDQAKINARRTFGRTNGLASRHLSIDIHIFNKDGGLAPNLNKVVCFWESLDDANSWGGREERAEYTHFQRRIKI